MKRFWAIPQASDALKVRLTDVPGARIDSIGRLYVSSTVAPIVDEPIPDYLPTLGVYEQVDGLYDHQARAAALIAAGRLLLCDEMGTGKTRSTAAGFARARAKRVLVVAPKYLETAWRVELTEGPFALGVPFRSATGLDIAKSTMLEEHSSALPEGAYFVHADILHEWQARICRHTFDAVVFDEVHLYASPRSQRAKAALAVAETSAQIRVALTGTPLVNRPADLWVPLTLVHGAGSWGSFFDFRRRYCLPGDAPVLLSDFTDKPIKDVRSGDRIVGWSKTARGNRSLVEARVLAHLTRRSKLQRVHLSDGTSIVCTPDHQWLNGYSRANVDQQYGVARTSRGGSRVVRVADGVKYPFMDGEDYMRGYLTGMMRGDGTVSRVAQTIEHPYEPRKDRGASIKAHKISLRVNDVEIVDRVAAYFKYFDVPFSRPSAAYIEGGNAACFNFLVRCDTQPRSRAWYAGFLGGIYDAEGSGRTISQYKKINPHTYWTIQMALRVFGFKFRSRPKEISIRASKKEFFRFWSIAAPVLKRKLLSTIYGAGSQFMSERLRVVRIEPLRGTHTVHTLTTSTGNYVAYGLGSRNCGAVQMPPGDYWTDTGPTNSDELMARMAPTYLRRTLVEIAELSRMPPFTRQRVTIDMDAADLDEHQALLRANRALVADALNGKATKQTLGIITRLRQQTSRAKIGATAERVIALLRSEQSIVIFVTERETATQIAARVARSGEAGNIYVATGAATADERAEYVASFQRCGGVIIATYAALGMGVTLHRAAHVVLHDLPWTFKDALQGEARIRRIGQTAPTLAHWMVAAPHTIDELIARVLIRKAEAIASVGIDDAMVAAEQLDLDGVGEGFIATAIDDALSRHFSRKDLRP